MDSTAYKYFIEELRQNYSDDFKILPLYFVKSPIFCSEEAFSSLKQFIETIIILSKECSDFVPKILLIPDSFWSNILLMAHKSIIDLLDNQPPFSHAFKVNGINLSRLISLCTQCKSNAISSYDDIEAIAMQCFLLEAFMYAGWCPNAFEQTAKFSSHVLFNTLKKMFHYLKINKKATILGYIWGAWLFAQKTEGIRDNSNFVFSDLEIFELNMNNISKRYIARIFGDKRILRFIKKEANSIPHPFEKLQIEEEIGFSLYVNNKKIIPDELLEEKQIIRPKMLGNKFIYKCNLSEFLNILWTIAFLFYDKTIYRIDLIRFLGDHFKLKINATFSFENENKLIEKEKNIFFGMGINNFIIRFIQNPFGFYLNEQTAKGITIFKTPEKEIIDNKESFQTVCAWASGKGITTLNETKLIGIYD